MESVAQLKFQYYPPTQISHYVMATQVSHLPDVPAKTTSCPFCTKVFKRIVNHLPHCNGRDYSQFLTQKTLKKREPRSGEKARCPKCSKTFSRLETHLRTSATCKKIDSQPLLANSTLSTLPIPPQSPLPQAQDAMFFTPPNPNSAPTAPATTDSGPIPTQRPKNT